MNQKPEFLQKVRVKSFAHSQKVWNQQHNCPERVISHLPNGNPETIYMVIGQSRMNEGLVSWGYDEGNSFQLTGWMVAYIVADRLSRRYLALLEDLEEVPER